MSYKEREVTSIGYSRLGTEAEDGMLIQRDLEERKVIKGDGGVHIPFHAVDRAVITTNMVERPDRNPYGCTAEGGGKVCSAKVCEGKTCD